MSILIRLPRIISCIDLRFGVEIEIQLRDRQFLLLIQGRTLGEEGGGLRAVAPPEILRLKNVIN